MMDKSCKIKQFIICSREDTNILNVSGVFTVEPGVFKIFIEANDVKSETNSWYYPIDDGTTRVQYHFSIVWDKLPINLYSLRLILQDEIGNEVELAGYTDEEIQQNTIHNSIIYQMGHVSYNNNIYTLNGFAFALDQSECKFSVMDEHEAEIPSTVHFVVDQKLMDNHVEKAKGDFCGFVLSFMGSKQHQYILKIADDSDSVEIRISSFDQIKRKKHAHNKTAGLLSRGIGYLKRNGLLQTIKRTLHGAGSSVSYETNYYDYWFHSKCCTNKELEKQRNTVLPYMPKISIIVPTFNTPEPLLYEMIESVRQQSYVNWELCIADGSKEESPARKIVLDYQKLDPRIKVVLLKENYGISGNTNRALELATGEYTALFDHDDLLELNALFEIVKSLQETRHDIVYTDEDKLDEKTGKYSDPHFKPDYDPDLLLSSNYITHFFAVKTDIIRGIGGFDSAYDGSQDYDVILKCTEKASSIHHVAKCLYHWRMHEGSTAMNPESKMYCYESGRKAIQDHLKRIGVNGKVEMMPKPLFGMYHTTYETQHSLISIVISNDDLEETKKCIHSLYSVSAYKDFEIIILDHYRSQASNDFYQELQKKHSDVQVVSLGSGKETVSVMNNIGAQHAHGEYLLFLNSALQMLDRRSLSEMVGLCSRQGVGTVGGKILQKDGYCWHAGMIVGFDGAVVRPFTDIRHKIDWSYMVLDRLNCDYSAVSGYCLMIKKKIFDEIGGFDEKFTGEYANTDLCLSLRNINKLVVYNAFSVWSIGKHDKKMRPVFSDIEKTDSDISLLQKKWPSYFLDGDPYYNRNFDLDGDPYIVQ
jgi:GT2 family glycosyltransferase